MLYFGVQKNLVKLVILLIVLTNFQGGEVWAIETVSIGLNYPATGSYREQGIQQKRAATLAVDEINAAGGILGRMVRLIQWDSQSDADVTTRNVTYMIEQDGVKMVFGSVSSADAIAAGEVCQSRNVLFFATLAYADAITGTQGHRYVFREGYNGWMAAKALSTYVRNKLPAHLNRYFYITTQDVWGSGSEAALRNSSDTQDRTAHSSISVPFPPNYDALWNAIQTVKTAKPDVLVLVLFGNELVTALKLVVTTNFKSEVQIVVPSITQGIAKRAGAQAMEGVISTTHWIWEIPYQYNYLRGKEFVERFLARYGNLPSTSAASAYTSVYEYKAAVERAGTFNGAEVVHALEGHEYQLLKDKQVWRDFDHQSVQTVYVVRGLFQSQSINDFKAQGLFEIIEAIPGDKLVQTREEWNAARLAVDKPIELEALPIDRENISGER